MSITFKTVSILAWSDNVLLKWYTCQKILFWTQGLPEGVLSNLCLCVCPSLNISETAHYFFLVFCMKLGHHKGTKVTEPDFWKKILGFTNGEKNHFWGILMFLSISLYSVITIFWTFIYIISSTLSNT